ncbi:MAG TPA: aquaporin [Actinomycetota bacterium]|nr:aquaporin [Actinomycetota bacterium]
MVPRSMQAWAGELVGTFGFVTIAGGAGILAADLGLQGVAFANGVGLAVMLTAFWAISGSHLNPAVTLSALVGRRIKPVDALGYVACQILGALGAGLTLRMIFEEVTWRPMHLGAPTLNVSSGKGLLVEGVFTFLLVIVVWASEYDARGPKLGGFTIGLTVFVGVLAVGPLTGGAFNPARYLGPAAVADELGDWWVYVVGTGIGGLAGGILYPTLFGDGFPWPVWRRARRPAAKRKPARKTAARKR